MHTNKSIRYEYDGIVLLPREPTEYIEYGQDADKNLLPLSVPLSRVEYLPDEALQPRRGMSVCQSINQSINQSLHITPSPPLHHGTEWF